MDSARSTPGGDEKGVRNVSVLWEWSCFVWTDGRTDEWTGMTNPLITFHSLFAKAFMPEYCILRNCLECFEIWVRIAIIVGCFEYIHKSSGSVMEKLLESLSNSLGSNQMS